jgi:hypothetical protein
MVKIRIKDRFVKIEEAPWKVFDQFEVFLNSMSVTLTKKFYLKIQQFMLFKQEQKKIDELQSMEEEKKIDMLMPKLTISKDFDDDSDELSPGRYTEK